MSFRARGQGANPVYANNRFYRSDEHLAVARASRGDFGSFGVGIHIDTTELRKLQMALRDAGAGYERSRAIQAQSLNRAAQRLQTKLKRSLQQWTGIKRQGELVKRIQLSPVASAGALVAGVTVRGRHLRITSADFGARWKRSWPGGRHSAWNRAQTAKGTFMAFGGGSSHGGGILFHRTSSSRFPIKPLWGPNLAREMERHRGEVQAMVGVEARWFVAECLRRAEVELRRAKARYGL